MEAARSDRDLTLYQKNIEALTSRRPDIMHELMLAKDREWERDDFDWEFVVGRKGKLSLKCIDRKDGRTVHQHSLIAPEAQAEKELKDLDIKDRTRIVVCGFGCGYHLEHLLDRIGDRNLITVIEPNPALFEELLYHRDLRELFGRKNYLICLGLDLENIQKKLTLGVSHLNVPPHVFYKMPYFDWHEGADEVVRDAIRELGTAIKFGFNTGLMVGKNFFNNIAVNFEVAMNNPGIEVVKNMFSGQPGFVVAPGPSLEKNVELLHEIKGKAPIIALDSSVKPLLKRNIIPDMVVTLDYSRRNYDKLIDVEIPDTVMMAAVEVYPMIPRTHKGKLFAYYHSTLTSSVYDPILGKKGHLMAGGSVLHDGFGLALYLGCNPIVLLGVDLGFPTDRYYMDGGFDDGELNKTIVNSEERQDLIEIEDIHGNPMKSWTTFKIYLNWLNSVVPTCGRKVIDATEGGAKIKGTDICTLRETIDEYVNDDFGGPYEKLLEIHGKWQKPSRKKTIRRLEKTLVKFKDLKRLSGDGILMVEEAIGHIEAQPPRNQDAIKAIRKIKKQDRTIKKSGDYLEFLTNAIFQKVFRIFNYRDERSETLEMKEWIKEVIEMSEELYKEMNQTTTALVDYFEKIIQRLKNPDLEQEDIIVLDDISEQMAKI